MTSEGLGEMFEGDSADTESELAGCVENRKSKNYDNIEDIVSTKRYLSCKDIFVTKT